MRIEAKARELVLSGKQELLKIEVVRFDDAAAKYLAWADAEYKAHPATAKRLRTSFASLRTFFARTAVTAITAGSIEDFKAWRRNEHGVREVTIRHDLHALSGFFQYAAKHNWVRKNVVRDVEIPSDAEAVRIHVVTPAEEMLYFAKCIELSLDRKFIRKAFIGRGGCEVPAHETTKSGDFMALHDLGRLMIEHGCRPEEFLEMECAAVNLEAGTFRIVSGKSNAAKRTLRMSPEGRSIFAKRLAKSGRFVFPGRKRGTHQQNCDFSHNKIMEATKLDPAFVVYDFRHTYATRMAKLGMPLPTLAANMGHANLRSIMKYIHINEAEMHAASDRYGAKSTAAVQAEQAKLKAGPVVKERVN
jgi:integrase